MLDNSIVAYSKAVAFLESAIKCVKQGKLNQSVQDLQNARLKVSKAITEFE